VALDELSAALDVGDAAKASEELLVFSTAEESISAASLLIASWLCGMSIDELLEETVLLFSFASGVLDGSLEDGADGLELHAEIADAATIPKVSAAAVFVACENFNESVTFLFSIFIQ